MIKGKVFILTQKKKISKLEDKVLYRVKNKYWYVGLNRYVFIDEAEGNRFAKTKLKFGFNKKFFVEG